MIKIFRPIIILLSFISACDYSGDCIVPYSEYDWKENPSVIEFCNDNPVDEDRVIEQFQYWADFSEDYPEVYEYDIIHSDCSEYSEDGVIRIERAPLGTLISKASGAYTRTYYGLHPVEREPGRYYMELYTRSASIFIRQFSGDKLIRHEIGHVYGWKHPDDQGHFMSHHVGDETCGLETWPPTKGEEDEYQD